MKRKQTKYDIQWVSRYRSKDDDELLDDELFFHNEAMGLKECTPTNIWEHIQGLYLAKELTVTFDQIKEWFEESMEDPGDIFFIAESEYSDPRNEFYGYEETGISIIETHNEYKMVHDGKEAINHIKKSNDPEKGTLIAIIKDLMREYEHKINYREYIKQFNEKQNQSYKIGLDGKAYL